MATLVTECSSQRHGLQMKPDVDAVELGITQQAKALVTENLSAKVG